MGIFSSEAEFEDNLYDYMVKHQRNPMNGRRVLSIIRQPNLGANGIPDLITIELDSAGKRFINVIELKNTEFHCRHIFQVAKYMSLVNASTNWQATYGDTIDVNPDSSSPIREMFPGAIVQGSIVVTGQESVPDDSIEVEGALFLCDITVYSLVIQELSLSFIHLMDGTPCPGAAEFYQSIIASLADPIGDLGDNLTTLSGADHA